MPITDALIGMLNGAIGAGTGLLTNKWNQEQQLEQQQKLIEQQTAAQKDLGIFNQGLAMEMWERTNYAEQRRQMEKAGLNPGLMYKGAGQGGTTDGGKAGSVTGGQANPNAAGMGIQLGLQAAMQQAQIENIKANTEKTKVDTVKTAGADTEKVGAETANAIAQTKLKEIETQIAELEKQVKTKTVQTEIDKLEAEKKQIQSNIAKTQAETRTATTQANVAEATQSEQIKQQGTGATLEQQTRINLQQTQVAAQKAGINLTNQQSIKVANEVTAIFSNIDKQWADNKLDRQEMEIKLKELLLDVAQNEFNTSTAAQIKQWTDIVMPGVMNAITRGKARK